MQKWEYKFVSLRRSDLEAELNKLGVDGWELVAWESPSQCIFKRPLK